MASAFSLSPRVRFREVGGEGVVVQMQSGEVVVVNGTGLRILQLLSAGVVDEPSLISTLEAEFETCTEQAREDLSTYLADLLTRGIVRQDG